MGFLIWTGFTLKFRSKAHHPSAQLDKYTSCDIGTKPMFVFTSHGISKQCPDLSESSSYTL